MASTIKLKNSTTTGNAPSSLETGEVAINVADGNLFYGSASAVLQNFVVDELQVKGNLTAQQYIVSSSVTYMTQSFSSGSTIFGDSADDTHDFTGNITASNNISASGDIIGDTLTVNAITFPQDTNITIQTPDEDESNGAGGHLTLEAGNGAGSNGNGGDLIFNAGKASGGGDSGDIIFNTFGTTAGSGTSGSIILNGSVDATSVTSSKFNVGSGGQFSVGLSNPIQSRLAITKADGTNMGIFDPLGSAGKLTIGDIAASGDIDVTGDVTASAFKGDGSALTNLPSQTDNNFTDADHTKLDGIEANADVTDTANVKSNLPSGTISSSAQVDHDSTTNFSADEHFTQANITTVGTVTTGDVSAILPSGLVSSSAQVTDFGDANITNVGDITLDSITDDTNGDTVITLTDTALDIDVGASTIISTKANSIDFSVPLTASIISASGNILGSQFKSHDKIVGLYHAASSTIRLADTSNLTRIYGTNITLDAPVTASIISASGTIVGSNLSGTNTGDQNISNLAITGSDVLFSHITSSGNISSSGTIVANKIESDQLVSHAGDANTGLQFGSDTVVIEGNNINIAKFASSYIELNKETKITLEKSSTTDGDANGDIVYFGGESGTIAEGQIVYYNSSGNWALADADAESSADGLLGVALGGDASADGILLKGMVTLDHDPGTVGDPLFLSTTPGQASSTAPNGANDIVRLIGYCLDNTNGQIYFNPSNDFIKHT